MTCYKSASRKNKQVVTENNKIVKSCNEVNKEFDSYNKGGSQQIDSEDIRVSVNNVVVPANEKILQLTREQQFKNEGLCGQFDCKTAEFGDIKWSPDQEINFRFNYLMNKSDSFNNNTIWDSSQTNDCEENIFRCQHCKFNTYSLLLLTLHHNQSHNQLVTNEMNVLTKSNDQKCDGNVAHIPENSRLTYESKYTCFEQWCADKKIKNITNENVLIIYFEQLSKTSKPTTLWTVYSMLRSVILMKKKVDISKYVHLNTFLKRKSKGYKPRKSKILTAQDIRKFLLEAPDKKFLLMKVYNNVSQPIFRLESFSGGHDNRIYRVL